jgi:hypothetical protein
VKGRFTPGVFELRQRLASSPPFEPGRSVDARQTLALVEEWN